MRMSSNSMRCLVRRRMHAHASVYGGFGEVHTFSMCRWTLEPCSVSGLPEAYKKMWYLWDTTSGKCSNSAMLVDSRYLFASV